MLSPFISLGIVVVFVSIFATSPFRPTCLTSKLRLFVLYFKVCGGDSYRKLGMPFYMPLPSSYIVFHWPYAWKIFLPDL
jgi:hypothetical protein